MNLLKAMFTVSGMTFISRILGFVREALMARYFGAGAATDAFNVAFKLPNLLRRVFAEGAFSQAFVPILAEYKQQKGEAATRLFVSNIAGMLSLILFIITLIGVIGAPVVIWLSAPGFTRDMNQFNLTVGLLRITFPYILLISLASLASGILNTYNKFSIPAFTPTFYNIASIACIICLSPGLRPSDCGSYRWLHAADFSITLLEKNRDARLAQTGLARCWRMARDSQNGPRSFCRIHQPD